MAYPICYGVGTGYDEDTGCPTGEKDVFAYGEKVWASHCWGALSGGEVFHIYWERLVSGSWTEMYHAEWTNPGYTSAYQYSSYTNAPSGTWRCRFLLNNIFAGGVQFTVEEAPTPEYQYYDVSGTPSDAEIWEGVNFIGNASMSFRLSYTDHYLTFKKTGYEEKTVHIGTRPGGETIYINYYLNPIAMPGIRCTLGAEYSVPSGTHPFNIWILYGIDADGTYENFASTGSYQWAAGGQINIEAPGQSVVTNIDLSNIALPSGTYDAITIILDGINTSIVRDWKIDNNVLVV